MRRGNQNVVSYFENIQVEDSIGKCIHIDLSKWCNSQDQKKNNKQFQNFVKVESLLSVLSLATSLSI